jgi:cobalt/nickel transport system ATP-binding protein
MIRIRAKELGFPDTAPVLAGVDVTIPRGQRVALVGGNGAGKTTLLRALVGLHPGAQVRVGGERVRGPADAVRAGVGLVFQAPDDQLFGASVIEDVLFGPRNLGLAEPAACERAHAALEAVGLRGFEQRRPETLSFGEKKRACLAGVLAMRPSVLLLDEPTAGLDPAGEDELVALLERLRPLTLVVATHAIDLVPALADRVLVLAGGCIAADGTTDEILACGDALRRARLRAPRGWREPWRAVT